MTPVLPAARPRVVATDLDGTLLREDRSVSARTRSALSAAEAAGVDVVFVTGRPPRWVLPVADHVAGHGIVLAGNGAFVVDGRTQEVLETRGFGHQEVLDLIDVVRDALPGAGLAIERTTGMVVDGTYRSPHGRAIDDALVLDRLEDLDEVPVGKILVLAAEGAGPDFVGEVERLVGERGHVSHSGLGHLAEISAPGVTKAAGLARWCQTRGVDAEHVWAFGDMPNDLPMLRWAGAGFAVANADPEVRAVAGYACPSNDEDGVAVVLEALLARAAAPAGTADDR